MKLIKTLTALYAALFLLTGCGKKERYAGEWHDYCVLNLKNMETAKSEWAMMNKKYSNTDAVSTTDILSYLKGAVIPPCPAGGVYTIETVGKKVTCSIPGHQL